MSAALATESCVLSSTPGRVRIHAAHWTGEAPSYLESALRAIPGVRGAVASPATRNVLVTYDPSQTGLAPILRALNDFDQSTAPPSLQAQQQQQQQQRSPSLPHHNAPRTIKRQSGGLVRARIVVKGMDRDPEVARRTVERLSKRAGVKRVVASQLTGRVLVEFSERQEDIRDLIGEIESIELPDLFDDVNPTHPMDPGPLIQSVARLVGASLGLGAVAIARAAGRGETPGSGVAVQTAGIISILQGIPIVRNGLRRLLGRDGADLAIAAPSVVTLTTSNNPLGLTLVGAESLRLLTETVPRRNAWMRYERMVGGLASAQAGATIRLEPGERTPLDATITAGTGTAVGKDGLPHHILPGEHVSAGSRLFGGPFVLQLEAAHEAFTPRPRPAPITPTLFSRYVNVAGFVSFGYAALAGVLTRSFMGALTGMLLVNPRTALIGSDAAESGAVARVLRAGVIVVGSRPGRSLILPNDLILECPRVLTDGYELTGVLPLTDAYENEQLLQHGTNVAHAAGSPWGGAFRATGKRTGSAGSFDGYAARATSAGDRYTLRPVTGEDHIPASFRMKNRGHCLLLLEHERDHQPLALFALRPRLATGVQELLDLCQRTGVRAHLLPGGDRAAARAVAKRANIELSEHTSSLQAIRACQATGAVVAFVADSASAAHAFEASDLAIGITDGKSRFPARADLLAPDLQGVAAIIEAGQRRKESLHGSILLSLAANVGGILWASRGTVGVGRASRLLYGTALGAIGWSWLRTRGGERPRSLLAGIVEPHPEHWARRDIDSVLAALGTHEDGLSTAEAARRTPAGALATPKRHWLSAVLDELRSPLVGMLAAGAALSLVMGAVGDVAIIGATIAANVAVGLWQERKAGKVAETLRQMGVSYAHVLRDGQPVTIPSTQVVPGDMLLLAPGDRVAADARIVSSQGLEVDEAALTGESLPVYKSADGGADASRIVLEGSDVTTGTARAVVVAVGAQTRMGATATALSVEESEASPLGRRLGQVLRLVLPLAATGGLIVFGAGLLRGRAILPQATLGATIALAAVPEGLPLLAGVSEAVTARRLAHRAALVRRVSAVEALGRVDVVCTDKTGTITEGHLTVRLLASADKDVSVPGALSDEMREILLTAALACPHPDSGGAGAHPTDVAVVRAAEHAGMGDRLRVERAAEASFDPVRSFQADVAGDAMCVKGAPEAIARRCSTLQRDGSAQPLSQEEREALLGRARTLAARGLRVLMVARGAPQQNIEDPQDLTALGFVGIADPIKAGVRETVRRCEEAGVRVVMLTGDHPETARAIAEEAGLLTPGREVLTGADLVELQNGELDARIEHAAVIARATPLDKLRIIESLRRGGHTVAMTGDGVNDAPALRLADVGVAMGRGGTEVARQTADVVLADDDFSTLVDTFVEGRSFWRNIRRAMSLLLGGNLGELGLVVGATALAAEAPLTVSQILAVNLITDVLPSLSVALQPPEHNHLSQLAREGTTALDTALRRDVLRRGALTAGPSLAAYLLALRTGTLPQARGVAFGSIIATQLAQTLDAGWSEGSLTRSVLTAVGGSAGVLLAALTFPPVRDFLTLGTPNLIGWGLIGGGALLAMALSHGMNGRAQHSRAPDGGLALPPAPQLRLVPAPGR